MANRKPPVDDFDYDQLSTKKEDDFFKEFGIDDDDMKIELRARGTAAFQKVNPGLVTYQGVDKIPVHNKHVELMY
ncbi:hypothetical protein ACJQWK_11958 [Exserohilum turcicum]